MLDIELIREKPEWVEQQIRRLGDSKAADSIARVIAVDEERRQLITQRDGLQGSRNRLNRQYGQLRGNRSISDENRLKRAVAARDAILQQQFDTASDIIEGTQDDDIALPDGITTEVALEQLMDAMRDLSERHGNLDEQVRQLEAELQILMLWLPNLPNDAVPAGASDEDNVAHDPQGNLRSLDMEFTPQPHWDLGPALDVIDFERGVRLSGTRFYILRGMGARLQRALIAFFLDQAREDGYTELYIPFLVQEDMLVGAAQFPKFTDVVYTDAEAQLFLLPTAEVALTNVHRDEILEEAQLPLYYAAQSPCFRHEKSSAGRDVRGIKRVHQFEKVERYILCTPETSYDELEKLTAQVEALCDRLGLAYRRLDISTGDLGFAAALKYDVEVWAPGSQEWLEVSSISNTEAFQARRANLKYYPTGTKKSAYVHTLNGSALALPRIIIAILESYQQPDGTVRIPDVLQSYLGGMTVIEPPKSVS